jgi:hypothetical protein
MSWDYRQPKPIFKNLSLPEGNIDLSRYVASMRTEKSLGSQAGTWSVRLVPQPDPTREVSENLPPNVSLDNFDSYLYDQIKIMDGVILGMGGASRVDGSYTDNDLMQGFVDAPYRSKHTENESIDRGLVIRGRDATKLLIVDNVASAPELANNPAIAEEFSDTPQRLEFLEFIRGLIKDENGEYKDNVFINNFLPLPIYWILANIPAMRVNLPLYGEVKKPVDLFQASLLARDEDRVQDTSMNMYSGSIINYMMQIIDEMFYELWVDTLPSNSPLNKEKRARPILFLRPKPYDHNWEVNSSGENIRQRGVQLADKGDTVISEINGNPILIPTWEDINCPMYQTQMSITEDDIIDKGIGRSDEEVYTLFKQLGSNDIIGSTLAATYGIYYPLIDIEMVRLFGMRMLQGMSRLLPYIGNPSVLSHLQQPKTPIAPDYRCPWYPDANLGFTNITSLEGAAEILKRGTPQDINQNDVAKYLTSAKRDRLWRWNRYNHIYESGRITIKGQPIFVGSKINLPNEEVVAVDASREVIRRYSGMNFYCMSVAHNYSFGDGWTTLLSLSRGRNEEHLREYARSRNFDKAIGAINHVYAGTGDKL